MSTNTNDADANADESTDGSGGGGHCSTPDSDGEGAEEIREGIGDRYESIEILEYHGDVFAEHWGEYDCFVGLMASGIAMRKTAPLLDDKWDDPAVVVIDEELTWAIPITGGHHGANQVAEDLASMGAVPAMTTASEAAGKQGVEERAKAMDAHVVNGDSTVATNLAVLDEELGPVERLDGPRAVLVGDDVTVLKRNDPGVVLGTGSVAGANAEQFRAAWTAALADTDYGIGDVEFVATGTRKADEEGLLAAADDLGLGLVAFEKETLERFEGPSPSRSKELIGWPGISEASALAAGAEHELLVEKTGYEDAVTVAVGR